MVNELRRFRKSFGYAFKGVKYVIRTQRNFRFHMGFAGAVLVLSQMIRADRTLMLILLLCIGLVMALECVNTALESAVDLTTEERLPLAGAAKDCAAAAVLIFAFFSAVIGGCVFFEKDNFMKIMGTFRDSPILIAAAAVYLVLWFVWVFVCFSKKK